MKKVLKFLLICFCLYMIISGFVIAIKYEEIAGIIVLIVGISLLVMVSVIKTNRLKRNYNKLQIGMTKQEIVYLLGQPTGYIVDNFHNKETLTWRQSEFKGLARGGTKQRSIVCVFENNSLVGYDSDNMGMHSY